MLKDELKAKWGTYRELGKFLGVSHTTARRWVQRDPRKLLQYQSELSMALEIPLVDLAAMIYAADGKRT